MLHRFPQSIQLAGCDTACAASDFYYITHRSCPRERGKLPDRDKPDYPDSRSTIRFEDGLMQLDPDAFVSDVVRQIRENQIVLFAGAGISRPSGLPNASDIVDAVLRCIRDRSTLPKNLSRTHLISGGSVRLDG